MRDEVTSCERSNKNLPNLSDTSPEGAKMTDMVDTPVEEDNRLFLLDLPAQ